MLNGRTSGSDIRGLNPDASKRKHIDSTCETSPVAVTSKVASCSFNGAEHGKIQCKRPRCMNGKNVDQDVRNVDTLSQAMHTVIKCLGEDPSRSGLQKTPQRAAKALLALTQGYTMNLKDVLNEAIFEEDHHELIVIRDIPFHSTCEHHLLPFFGKVHVGYVPNGHILGLSKFARVADMFARRLQVQERLTQQIANAIMEAVGAKGVAVIIEGTHMCMEMRGVQKIGAVTVTSAKLGVFKGESQWYREFQGHVQAGARGR